MRIVFFFLQLPCQGNVFQGVQDIPAICPICNIQSKLASEVYSTVMDKEGEMSRIANKSLAVPSIFFWSLFSDLCSLIQTLTRPNLIPEQCIVGKPGQEWPCQVAVELKTVAYDCRLTCFEQAMILHTRTTPWVWLGSCSYGLHHFIGWIWLVCHCGEVACWLQVVCSSISYVKVSLLLCFSH